MSERQEYVSSDQWSEKISDMCALDLVIRKEKTTHIKELKSGNNFFHPKPVLQAAVDNSALPDTIGLDDKVANMPRRNPTEGSNSRTIMTTISGLCNQPHAERRFMNKIYQNKTRSINLTTTADKFLFGTLDALSQRDEMLREEKSKSLDRSLCVQTHSHDTHFRFVENDGSQNHITTAQSGYYPTLSISMVSGSIETHTSDSSELPNLDRTANATHPDGRRRMDQCGQKQLTF